LKFWKKEGGDKCNSKRGTIALRVTQYILIFHLMIKSFKHKGLKLFYETGSTAGIQAAHKKKLKMRLIALDTATQIKDMDLPGFRLHTLKGKMEGLWAIDVSGNWRITFEFKDEDVFIVNYKDYH